MHEAQFRRWAASQDYAVTFADMYQGSGVGLGHATPKFHSSIGSAVLILLAQSTKQPAYSSEWGRPGKANAANHS